MKDERSLKKLAGERRVSGRSGVRAPESLWRVRTIPNAASDAARLFRRLDSSVLAHASVIDQLRALMLFPDKRPCVAGELLDIRYEPIHDEVFYRLWIDDPSFEGRSLVVFFYPAPLSPLDQETSCAGIVYVVGLVWSSRCEERHVLLRMRDRTNTLVLKKR